LFGNGMGTGMGLWLLLGMLILAVVIPGIVLLMVWFMQKTVGGAKSRDSSMEILKMRYARGEISREEFEEKKNDILS
jgi:putative membrane protein